MKQNEDVTIIIPNFNGAADIDECMDALERQTYPADVIVVDDGSTDESAGVVEMYQAWMKNEADGALTGSASGGGGAIRSLTLIKHTKNRGFAAAVNTGIHAAKTPYVILLNNDAFAEDTFTEALVRAIKRRKKAFAVQAMMLQMCGGAGSKFRRRFTGNVDSLCMNDNVPDRTAHTAAQSVRTHELRKTTPTIGEADLKCRRRSTGIVDSSGDYFCALGWAFSPGRDKEASAYEKPARITSACAGAAIYDRTILEKIGLFDEAHFCYIEDTDVGLRAFRAGYNSYFEPEAVVYHKGSATSGSRYNAFKTKMTTANSLYTAYKNMPAWMLALYAPLLAAGTLIKGMFYAKKGFGRDWLKGLSEGTRKIARYRKAGKPYAVRPDVKRDALLAMELLGNCVRRGLP